jgi:hypothetical protein
LGEGKAPGRVRRQARRGEVVRRKVKVVGEWVWVRRRAVAEVRRRRPSRVSWVA